MIIRTEVEEKPNGDIMTIQYNENNVPVKIETRIKTGGCVRCEIMNPERFHTAVDNMYKHFLNKRKMQSDEHMKVFDDYAERKRSQFA